MGRFDQAQDVMQDTVNNLVSYSRDHQGIVLGATAVAVIGSLFVVGVSRTDKRKPGTRDLGGGSIKKAHIKQEYDDYSKAYGKEAGDGILDRTKTTELVNTFYNLVTDIYEWGWGQSFHFSPLLPGKTPAASEAAHEGRLAALLRLKPGMKCLDVGCGVGGPMRTIASTSGANVTGITINDYQVQRASYHNDKLGVGSLCEAIEGNFLNMPFPEASFDGAYAIEATCHADKLQDAYAEVYRVLKPGCYFASYEWVSTTKYDPKNRDHVRVMDEINYGNGLPEMRTYKEAEQAGKDCGFKLVLSYDVATASPVCGPWYGRLAKIPISFNRAMVNFFAALHLCPKGVKDVHDMLINVATSLVAGGETGIFTPMHLLVFQKPEANGKGH
ncbi:hypothetical protein ABBQ38_001222 [Trebouxia sp. C0009 RCD-2024]